MMKKLLAAVCSALLALLCFAACAKDAKLRVSAPETYYAEVGTEFTVPQPQVFSLSAYSCSVSVSGEDGASVVLSDTNSFYIAKDQTYRIEYAVINGKEKASCTSVLEPTDTEKPYFRSDLTEFKVIKGDTVTVPDLGITDRGGPIVPQVEVTDNFANVVPVTDGAFQAGAEASAYSIKVTAADKAGNAAERTLTALARYSADEIEFFEDEYYLNSVSTTDFQTVALDKEKTAAESSKSSLKWHVDSACWWPEMTLSRLGVTDWSEARSLSMWVYNDSDVTDFEWHGLAINGVWESLQYFNTLPAREWTEVVIPLSALNGSIVKDVSNVTGLRFSFDNSPDGMKNMETSFYFDNFRLNFPEENWKAQTVETEEAQVIEINTFEDKPHFKQVDMMSTDLSTTTAELSSLHTTKFAGSVQSDSALKLTMTHANNSYPRFVSKLDRTLAAAGKKLSELPDNASFKWDLHFDSASTRANAADGYGLCNMFVFYLKDSNTEQKPVSAERPVIYKGQDATTALTMKDLRGYCKTKKIDVDDIDRIGLFFFCDKTYEGEGTTIFFIDNARVEVPLYDLNWEAKTETREDGTVVREINSFDDLGRFKSVGFDKNSPDSKTTLSYVNEEIAGGADRGGLACLSIEANDGYPSLRMKKGFQDMTRLGDWTTLPDDAKIAIDTCWDAEKEWEAYIVLIFRYQGKDHKISMYGGWFSPNNWTTMEYAIGDVKTELKKQITGDIDWNDAFASGNIVEAFYFVDAAAVFQDTSLQTLHWYFDNWRIEIPPQTA